MFVIVKRRFTVKNQHHKKKTLYNKTLPISHLHISISLSFGFFRGGGGGGGGEGDNYIYFFLLKQANKMTCITHGFLVSVVSDVRERVRDFRITFALYVKRILH